MKTSEEREGLRRGFWHHLGHCRGAGEVSRDQRLEAGGRRKRAEDGPEKEEPCLVHGRVCMKPAGHAGRDEAVRRGSVVLVCFRGETEHFASHLVQLLIFFFFLNVNRSSTSVVWPVKLVL